jgi:molybdate transport system permease protein
LFIFFYVTLPLILPGILAGSVVGFAKALGEFGATITFVSNIPGETQTIASAIYSLLQVPGQEFSVLRMIGVSIFLSFGALILSEFLARKMVRR